MHPRHSTPAALAAKEATSTIPIVFVFASEPVKTGLVTSLAHPGQNLTGVADSGLDLVEKRLDLLKELNPKMSRVAALGNPTSAAISAQCGLKYRRGHGG